MVMQIPIENPLYPALRSQDVAADMHGPETPPRSLHFCDTFIRENEKGGARNAPNICTTALQIIDLLFVQEDWDRL